MTTMDTARPLEEGDLQADAFAQECGFDPEAIKAELDRITDSIRHPEAVDWVESTRTGTMFRARLLEHLRRLEIEENRRQTVAAGPTWPGNASDGPRSR